MAIRIIEPPDTIQVELVKDDGSPKYEDFPFSRFIESILNQSEWSMNWRCVQNAMEIETACKKADGGAFELADGPYAMLKKYAENPTQGYNIHPLILRQITPYFEAIFDAKKKGTE